MIYTLPIQNYYYTNTNSQISLEAMIVLSSVESNAKFSAVNQTVFPYLVHLSPLNEAHITSGCSINREINDNFK